MKLSCHKQQLLKIINTVQKAVSSKSIMPILECIKIDADATGNITVTGNNLDLCVEYNDLCNVTEAGSIAISSKMFGEIIRRLPDDEVKISVNEDNNVTTIKCGKSEFNIQGLSGFEYPSVPEVKENYSFSISQKALRKMIKKTIFAVSQNEARKPILTGSLFEIETGVLSVVATDGYRLAICKETINSSLENKKFVIPGLTLREVFKVLEDDEEKMVNIIVSDRHVQFNFDNYKVITRLLEGEYINYKPVLLTPNSIVVIANTSALSESLERASLLINDDISAKAEKVPVRLSIIMDKIEITCMTGKGKVHDVVDVSVNGEDIEIGFNYKYLLEALRACEEEEVKMEFSNPRSSCFIRSANGDESYTFMILPVRLYNDVSIVENIKTITTSINEKRPKAKIYVESIYPVDRERYPILIDNNVDNNRIRKINGMIESLCNEKGYVFINMFDELNSPTEDKLIYEYSKDGLHLSDEGYKIVTKKLKSVLEAE